MSDINIHIVPAQVIEWFEEYAEEFFQTHTELGESLEIAETLSLEVKHFEESTQVCNDKLKRDH